jgi:hypothetical protein
MSIILPDPLMLRDAGMVGGSRIFRLEHYFRVITSIGTITIPTGTSTDGASIPRCFWSIFSPFDEFFPAALLHDYLYSRASTGRIYIDRKQADRLFMESMRNLGVPWLTRHIIWIAARMFGNKRYKSD